MKISLFQLAQVENPAYLFALGFTKRDIEMYVGQQMNKFEGILIKLQRAGDTKDKEIERIKNFAHLNLSFCREIKEKFKLFDTPIQYDVTVASANRYLDQMLGDE